MCHGVKHSFFRLLEKYDIYSKNAIKIFGCFMILSFIMHKNSSDLQDFCFWGLQKVENPFLYTNQIANHI